MAKIIAVDISDHPEVRSGEAVMVIEMGQFPQRAMREIWHGSKDEARAMRDALDALLTAPAPAPAKRASAARRSKKKV